MSIQKQVFRLIENVWEPGETEISLGLQKFLDNCRTLSEPGEVCPLCGWTLTEYRRTELLGCGLCYSSLALDSKWKVNLE